MSYRGGPRTLAERVADIEERLRRAVVTITTTVSITVHAALSGLDADDHPHYQLRDELGEADGYASLDGSGVVPDDQLPGDLARLSDIPDVTDQEDLEMLVWLTMAEA